MNRSNTPQVSVIIPTLNESRFVADCVQSVQRCCSDTPIEIIVVDNGSTDGTPEIVEGLHGVELVRTQVGTIAAQRNAGADRASGAIFAFLDADCTVEMGWLPNALRQFGDAQVVAVGAAPEVPLQDTTWVQRTWAFLKQKRVSQPRRVSWLASANLWVRARAFQQVGGFDPTFVTCEDADLGYRLHEIGALIYDASVTVQHHREPRTLWQFFRKEIWHGKNSYRGVRKGRLTLAELPSLVVPVWYLLSYLVFLAGMCGALVSYAAAPLLSLAGLVGLWLPPIAYSLRAIAAKGRPWGLPAYLVIYFTYFSARCVALLGALSSNVWGAPRLTQDDSPRPMTPVGSLDH